MMYVSSPIRSLASARWKANIKQDEETAAIREKQRAMIDALPLDKYELDGDKEKKGRNGDDDEAWAAAERSAAAKGGKEHGVKRKRDKKDKEHRKEHRRDEKKTKRKSQ